MRTEEQPQRHVGTAAVIRRPDQSVLLVRTDHGWDLPGGTVQPGEDPADACARHVRATAGFDIAPDRVLLVEHEHDTRAEAVHLLFDGGTADGFALPPENSRWAGPSDLDGVTAATWQRIVRALRALTRGAPYIPDRARQQIVPGHRTGDEHVETPT